MCALKEEGRRKPSSNSSTAAATIGSAAERFVMVAAAVDDLDKVVSGLRAEKAWNTVMFSFHS